MKRLLQGPCVYAFKGRGVTRHALWARSSVGSSIKAPRLGFGCACNGSFLDCAAVAVAVYIVPICFWYIVLPARSHSFPRPSSVTLVCCPLLRLLFSLEASMAAGTCCFCLPAAPSARWLADNDPLTPY